jgi:exopolyphosphatase/guanosine-5'-triphosphate,3'-diphosphate pyrophosphatase
MFPDRIEHKSLRDMVDKATQSSPARGSRGRAKAVPKTAPVKANGHRPADIPSAHPRPSSRRNYAALDLGTNNCRLLIARPEGARFTVVDAFSRIVRLGEGLAATGAISDAAMDRALSALSVCADKLVRRNVHMARSVATEACRRASNGAEFVERVYRETGIKLDIISPQEEARLAVLGCHALLEDGDGPALIFDIGGGSTELVLVETSSGAPRTLDWRSLPWGVVSLSESVPHDSNDASARTAAYAQMRAQVRESIGSFANILGDARGVDCRLLGTSGTVTTLASVYLGLTHYERRLVDGLRVDVTAMRDICTMLADQSVKTRGQQPCIGPERADLVVAGCAILESIFDVWPAERVGVADRGIREGILRQLMAAGDRV